MNTNTLSQSKSHIAKKSLGELLDILTHAQVDATLERVTAIRNALFLVLVSVERREISKLDAKVLWLHLQEELSSVMCKLGEWQLQLEVCH